jgi:hypothetical protein
MHELVGCLEQSKMEGKVSEYLLPVIVLLPWCRLPPPACRASGKGLVLIFGIDLWHSIGRIKFGNDLWQEAEKRYKKIFFKTMDITIPYSIQ